MENYNILDKYNILIKDNSIFQLSRNEILPYFSHCMKSIYRMYCFEISVIQSPWFLPKKII